MKRIGIFLLWIALVILPEPLALRLLDLIKPDWEKAANEAMKRRP